MFTIGLIGGEGIVGMVITAIVIIAIVAIAYIIITQGFGFPIPPWAIKVFWIVVAVFVAILAIKLVLSM